MSDPVNSPSHYKLNAEGVECIDAIKASMSPLEYQGYLKGNAMKYLWRFRYKNHPVQDLKKAQWYLAKLTEEQGNNHAERTSADLDYGAIRTDSSAALYPELAKKGGPVPE